MTFEKWTQVAALCAIANGPILYVLASTTIIKPGMFVEYYAGFVTVTCLVALAMLGWLGVLSIISMLPKRNKK